MKGNIVQGKDDLGYKIGEKVVRVYDFQHNVGFVKDINTDTQKVLVQFHETNEWVSVNDIKRLLLG